LNIGSTEKEFVDLYSYLIILWVSSFTREELEHCAQVPVRFRRISSCHQGSQELLQELGDAGFLLLLSANGKIIKIKKWLFFLKSPTKKA